MPAEQAPEVEAVRVVAAEPDRADRRALSHLRAAKARPIDDVVYIVKIYTKRRIESAGSGFALYVGEIPIPKYWHFEGGIYFTAHDPDFVASLAGEEIRFSEDRLDFVGTGVRFPGLPALPPTLPVLPAVPAPPAQRLGSKRDALRQ